MNTKSEPSLYRYCMSRLSTVAVSTLVPALNVRSTTLPESTFLSLVRTKAPPLPGLTCWNSTTDHSCPSMFSTRPFLRSFVVATICLVLGVVWVVLVGPGHGAARGEVGVDWSSYRPGSGDWSGRGATVRSGRERSRRGRLARPCPCPVGDRPGRARVHPRPVRRGTLHAAEGDHGRHGRRAGRRGGAGAAPARRRGGGGLPDAEARRPRGRVRRGGPGTAGARAQGRPLDAPGRLGRRGRGPRGGRRA